MKRTARLKTRKRMQRTRMSRISTGQRAFLSAYTALRLEILERDKHRCRFCLAAVPSLEIHHIVKRSAAPHLKLDRNNLVSLCPAHHARTDFPYSQGRLVVLADGEGQFRFELEYRDNKFQARGAIDAGTANRRDDREDSNAS